MSTTYEQLEALAPASDGRIVIVSKEHGTHRATTYDPSMARLTVAAPDMKQALRNILEWGWNEQTEAEARAALAKVSEVTA